MPREERGEERGAHLNSEDQESGVRQSDGIWSVRVLGAGILDWMSLGFWAQD